MSPTKLQARPRLGLPGFKKPPAVLAPTPLPATTVETKRAPSDLRIAIGGNAFPTGKISARVLINQRATKTFQTLVERFPCFQEPAAPLKVGIYEDILAAAPDLARHDIANALGNYIHNESYQGSIIEGAVRLDLQGKPAGIVTKAHAGFAAKQLKKLAVPVKAVVP